MNVEDARRFTATLQLTALIKVLLAFKTSVLAERARYSIDYPN